jgi:hypothetical protein
MEDKMKNKECKITCDGKEVATVECTGDGCNFKVTEEGKKLLKDHCKHCC